MPLVWVDLEAELGEVVSAVSQALPRVHDTLVIRDVQSLDEFGDLAQSRL